jgi:two-component system, OmpR family, response regulator RegX3
LCVEERRDRDRVVTCCQRCTEESVTRILIIEDEQPMAESIKYTIEKEGIEAAIAPDGEEGLRRFETEHFDLLVLDLMLPGMDGMELCKKVRLQSDIPIVMLTAKDSELDKVLGLELGADDYVTKPFSMRELLARLKAVMRRAAGPAPEQEAPVLLEGGDVAIDIERHEVVVRGKVVDIPLIEYRLLELFLKNQGRVLTREHLINTGWEGAFYSQSKALDVHIRRLREKVEEDPAAPRRIITIRGVGYRFEPRSSDDVS